MKQGNICNLFVPVLLESFIGVKKKKRLECDEHLYRNKADKS